MAEKNFGSVFVVISALFTLVVLSSCNYHTDLRQAEVMTDGNYYAFIRRNVIDAKCMSCHFTGAKVMDLSTYAALMNPKVVVPFHADQSPLWMDIEAGKMPKNGAHLGESDCDLIRDWINMGAPEGVVIPPPADPPQPNWAWLNKNIFTPRCLSCHTGTKPKGGTSFESYQDLIDSQGAFTTPITAGAPDQSGVYSQVADKKMPPENAPKLNPDELKAIYDWISAGATETSSPK